MVFYEPALENICREISKGTGLTPYDILKIGNSAYYRYKKYQIEKKKPGEFRTIGHPAKEVKMLQRWIVDNLLPGFPVHECATAYKKGSGIKKNANAHRQNNYILKMDFSKFFPSIVPGDFIAHFRRHNGNRLSDEELFFVSKMLFWKENRQSPLTMSIGAPSSPLISNTIMYEFDQMVNSFCVENNLVYSRYADDICISSKKKNTIDAEKFISHALKVIEYPRLRINRRKTLHLSKAGRRSVTGVVINNRNQLSLGRERKRLISSMVHHYKEKRLNKDETERLKGLLAFANDIEGSFIIRLKSKYGIEVMDQLI